MFQEFFAQSQLLQLPLLALAIFFLTFVSVLIRVLWSVRQKQSFAAVAALPLDDGTPIPMTHESTEDSLKAEGVSNG